MYMFGTLRARIRLVIDRFFASAARYWEIMVALSPKFRTFSPCNMITNSPDACSPTYTKLTCDDEGTQTDRKCNDIHINSTYHVAYVNQIMRFRDRVKPLLCNREFCPVIKERLRQHQLGCHTNDGTLEIRMDTEKEAPDVDALINPLCSRLYDQGMIMTGFEDHSSQTTDLASPISNNDLFNDSALVNETNIVEHAAPNKEYKENFIRTLKICLQELPISGNFDEPIKMITERMAHELSKEVYNQYITKFAKEFSTLGVNTTFNTFIDTCNLSRNIVVLTSGHNLSSDGPFYHNTSTLKTAYKPRLNEDERSFMENVVQLIRAWIETLSKEHNALEEEEFKDVIINDLASDIMDEVKFEQLSPNPEVPKDKLIYYLLLRWLYKYQIYKDLKSLEPHSKIEEFMKRLKEIDIPDLIEPRHSNREAMNNIKYSNMERKYIRRDIDILEDRITHWMNEQSSEIYVCKDKVATNKMIHKLALSIEDRLKNKRSEEEIKKELMNWLDKIVKKEVKQNIDLLSDSLKDKILKLTKDESSAERHEMKMSEQNSEHITYKQQYATNAEESTDIDINIKELIDTFINHNYQVDDSLVKGAFGHLLMTEINKLCPTPEKENDIVKLNSHKISCKYRFDKEIQYIKYISDWLKNIEIDDSFNTPGNKKRIEFVNDLAKHICEIELNRIKLPNAMDWDEKLKSTIHKSIITLPILPNSLQYAEMLVIQLFRKITAHRSLATCCVMNRTSLNGSNNMQEQNIAKFIDQYLNTNGKDLEDDQVKSEACTARLLNEIKNMVDESSNSSTSGKFANVLISRKETIEQFDKELTYAREIGDWMNNMPLQPTFNPEAQEMRIKQISELAKHISDMDKSKLNVSNNTLDDSEFSEFIKNWIAKVSLSTDHTIDVSTLVQQLQRRIKRINEMQPPEQTCPSEKKSKRVGKKLCKCKSSLKHTAFKMCGSHGSSGELIVNAIEKWCSKIQTHEKNKDNIEKLQNDIATRLFQKVGELSMDPRIDNDEILFSDLLSDEIDLVIEDLPKIHEILTKKDSLKRELIESVIHAKAVDKEKNAGSNYKQSLENTIEASLPTPIIVYDPGFELYKIHLANIFILENFDHGNDTEKLKYEKKIKDKIDNYFQHAQKRNASPLSRDKIYNKLYSALFKVPIPHDISLLKEVGEVKTGCEVEVWFEGLPLRRAVSLNEELEREQIVTMLAKKICKIEKKYSCPDRQIHKEITKWLGKLPLQHDQKANTEKFAQDLVNKLKSSKEDRQCVTKLQSQQGGPKKRKSIKKMVPKNKGMEDSQIAGPSCAGKMWFSPPPYCQDTRTAKEKSGDIILEIVENWCNEIPLLVNSPNENSNAQAIKDNLIIKILVKANELYIDPKTFYNDLLFNAYLDEELERLINELPVSCDFNNSRDTRKYQLKTALNSVKPLIEEERILPEYIKELRNTVTNFLDKPQNTKVEQFSLYKELVEDITNYFIQYHYNRDDFEGKQLYKNAIREAIEEYFLKIKNSDANIETLMTQNKLLCELAKIPTPKEGLMKEKVEEINIKNEVSEFFNEIVPDDKGNKILKRQIVSSLAKKLNDLEKNGNTCENDKIMMEEISRSLRKLNTEVNINNIEAFVNKLKTNEIKRTMPPFRHHSEQHELEDSRYSLREQNPQNRVIYGGGIAIRTSLDTNLQPHTTPTNLGGTKSPSTDAGASKKYHLLPGPSNRRPPHNTPPTHLVEINQDQIAEQNRPLEDRHKFKSLRKIKRSNFEEDIRERCNCRDNCYHKKDKSCMPKYKQAYWNGLPPPFWVPFPCHRCL